MIKGRLKLLQDTVMLCVNVKPMLKMLNRIITIVALSIDINSFDLLLSLIINVITWVCVCFERPSLLLLMAQRSEIFE